MNIFYRIPLNQISHLVQKIFANFFTKNSLKTCTLPQKVICLPQFMQYTINHIQKNVKKMQNYLAVPNNFVNTHTE